MKRRNQTLGFIVLFLVIANLSLLSSDDGLEAGTTFNISDTTSIRRVSLVHGDFQNVLEKKEGVWLLNDEFHIDERFRKILLAVLRRVTVKGKLGASESETALGLLQKNGIKVTIEGEEERKFSVVGNGTLTKTYFISEDQDVFEVEIPGYKDYVGGIFQLTTDQWKDRLLFRSSIQTIQGVTIRYKEGDDLQVSFEDRFFTVKGLNAFDTTAVFDWLGTYEFLQANERMSSGRFPRYDSLLKTEPMATVILDDLTRNEPFILMIYPKLPNENIHLATTEDGSMVVFEKRRVDAMLKKRSDLAL